MNLSNSQFLVRGIFYCDNLKLNLTTLIQYKITLMKCVEDFIIIKC